MKKLFTIGLIGAFLAIVGQAQDVPGDVGSAECLAVQWDAQAAVIDGEPYNNHGKRVSTASNVVRPAVDAWEITSACASCIMHQFARRIPIDEQVACGTSICYDPVQESPIGTPGTTGYPFILGNRNTANVDGQITALGVDRWDVDATWTVSLWNDSCVRLAEVVVTGGTGWYYGDIIPVSVSAGEVFYVGYEVNNAAGSYVYRDTASPVDVGAYTVDYASFNSVGTCPSDLNGYLVSPVDVTFCTTDLIPSPESGIKSNEAYDTKVNTDVDQLYVESMLWFGRTAEAIPLFPFSANGTDWGFWLRETLRD